MMEEVYPSMMSTRLLPQKQLPRVFPFLWRSTLCLVLINVILLFLISQIFFNEKRGQMNSKIAESTLDSEYFQDSIDSAQEIFDYMHDQKNGLIGPKSLDLAVQQVYSHRCWKSPDKPRLGNESDWKKLGTWNSLEGYVYSAYSDRRRLHGFPDAASVVQVLIMARRFLFGKIFCQLWFKTDPRGPEIVSGIYREIWQRPWDPRNRFYAPWLITCPVLDSRIPSEVSLVFHPCQQAPSSGIFQVQNAEPKVTADNPDKVVVCVKGMDFIEDNALRLIEWLELQYILGADKVVLYTYSVHPRAQTVITHYANKQQLLQIPLTLPGNSPNSPFQRSKFIWRNRQQKRRNEIIPYNDCLYRHLYSHKYLLIVDTDEAVVPVFPLKNWSQLLSKVRKHEGNLQENEFTAFSIRNAFFFDNLTQNFDERIPPYMHILRHNVRSKKISAPGNYGKSFVYIPNVVSVFNHFPLHKLKPGLKPTKYLDAKVALKLHYKKTCPIESRDECPLLYTDTVKDDHLEQFADKLTEAVKFVVKELSWT